MENSVASSERKVVYLKLDDVLPNRFQPRIKFDEQALHELSQSIKEHGVLSPITVRPLGNKYEIIAGERRYKASLMAGLTDIPVLIVNIDDKESAEIALIENVQRKDLTAIEEAISYKKIFDMNIGISQEALARKLGKSQSSIANKLRLLNLSDEVQEALLENKISERHARSLLRLKDKKYQNQLLNKIIEERLTVRKTDEEIIKMLNKNKDIEILDFESENESLQPENIKNPLDRFENLYNLPKTQIVEDKEDEFIPTIPDVASFENTYSKLEELNKNQNVEEINKEKKLEDTIELPISKISEMSQNNQESIVNPGFLDITKIENEANDINNSSNKISLEELLKMPDEPKKSEVEEQMPKPPIANPSRFFTMFEEETKNGEEKFSFEPQQTTNIFSDNNELSSIDNQPNLDFNFDLPKMEESNDFQFNLNDDIFKSNLLEEEKIENNINPLTSLNIDIEDSTPSSNISEEVLNYDFSSPLIQPIDENIELPKGEIVEETNDFENEIFNKLETIPLQTPTDYTPIYEEDENEVVEQPIDKHKDNSKYGAADLKTIINTIRKCAETIEKYGYVIDTEEFDFEDMYQVIFKVQKKQ